MQRILSSMPPINRMRRQKSNILPRLHNNITNRRRRRRQKRNRHNRRDQWRTSYPTRMRLPRQRYQNPLSLLRRRATSRRTQRRRRSISPRRSTKRPHRTQIMRRRHRRHSHAGPIRTKSMPRKQNNTARINLIPKRGHG